MKDIVVATLAVIFAATIGYAVGQTAPKNDTLSKFERAFAPAPASAK